MATRLFAPGWTDVAGSNFVPGEEIPEEQLSRLSSKERERLANRAERDPERAKQLNFLPPMKAKAPLPSHRRGEPIALKGRKYEGEVTPAGRVDKLEFGEPQTNLDTPQVDYRSVDLAGTPTDELYKPSGKPRLREDPTHGNLQTALQHIMLPETVATIAKAGRAGADWYEIAGRELTDLFQDDAPRFLALLAGTSSQKPVQANLRIAFQIWNAWEKAGRPEGHALNRFISQLKVKMTLPVDIQKAGLALGSSNPAQEGWSVLFGNEDAKPYKLDSFRQNLQGNSERVTNDNWMAKLHKIGQTLLSQPEWYLALSLNQRQAAAILNSQLEPGEKPWTPRRVQAAAWTWGKSLAELMGRSRSRRFTPEGTTPLNPAEALKIHTNGDVHAAADFFHTLVNGTDPDTQVVRDILSSNPRFAKGWKRLQRHARDWQPDYDPTEPAAHAHARHALEPAAREVARSMVGADPYLARSLRRKYAKPAYSRELNPGSMSNRFGEVGPNTNAPAQQLGRYLRRIRALAAGSHNSRENGAANPFGTFGPVIKRMAHTALRGDLSAVGSLNDILQEEGFMDVVGLRPLQLNRLFRHAVAVEKRNQRFAAPTYGFASVAMDEDMLRHGQEHGQRGLNYRPGIDRRSVRDDTFLGPRDFPSNSSSGLTLQDRRQGTRLEQQAKDNHISSLDEEPIMTKKRNVRQFAKKKKPRVPGSDSVGGGSYQPTGPTGEGGGGMEGFLKALREAAQPAKPKLRLVSGDVKPKPKPTPPDNGPGLKIFRGSKMTSDCEAPVKYAANPIREDGSVTPPVSKRPSAPNGPEGRVFVSSHDKPENLSFDKSLALASSANHKALLQQTNATRRKLGLKGNSFLGIGDWHDGAEPSVMQSITSPHDQATLRYAAAWYGLHANQKSVLVFHPGKGPDSTYTIDVEGGNIRAIRQALDEAGVPQRTLIPHKGGVKVVIYDEGRHWRSNVGNFASKHNAHVIEATGRGKYIGARYRPDQPDAEARTEARAAYRKIIDAYESRRGGDREQAIGGRRVVRSK